jgi:hypothetical protein
LNGVSSALEVSLVVVGRSCCEVAVLERPSTTERYTRSLAAAVIAVVTLILAANAGPARAAEPGHSPDRHAALAVASGAQRP